MRIRLSERKLPDYTRGEELFNMISHIAGGALAVTTLVLCVVKSVLAGRVAGIVSSAVYGGCMLLMYCMSSIYHGLRPSLGKKVLQVLDHCAIYFMIAGTYTPILLCAIRLSVTDAPGTMAAVANVFADHGVSLKDVLQLGERVGGSTHITFMTHMAQELDVQAALEEIRKLSCVREVESVIRAEA